MRLTDPLTRARSFAWMLFALLFGVGCGSTPPVQEAPSSSATTTSPELVEAPAIATRPALMTAEMRGTAPACAVVSISFDSRALPAHTTPDAYANWVAGNADDIRRAAPAGSSPRMYDAAGAGTVHALFDGDTDAEVLARCEQTLASYMPTSPDLPLVGSGSATHITLPCQLCD